ncbi:hypothetical protein [Arthrobacter sp. IK3]|uniref:hypothetical protein n=1 Tax=Arthrobacter sp. IK3 TaxID=3448169 RepID=UPI003EE2D815
MLESVTAESVFAEIMMDESSPKAFLLVEGTDEDSVFFGHVSEEVVMIVCGGKRCLLGAAQLAEENGYLDVYGLVDSDFDRISGRGWMYPAHVVATTAYDLLADIVMSSPDVLRRTLSAHAAPAVATVETVRGSRIEDAVYALTSRLAAARLAALMHKYPLTFKRYDFFPVVDASYRPASLEEFVHHAASRTPSFQVDEAVVGAANHAFGKVGHSRHSSGGHDIVSASAALLRRAGSQVSVKTISGTIIATATCEVLASLPSIQNLAAIARAHSGAELFECFAA